MVAAETAEFEAFDAHTDFEADLDTDADQHLRRRSGGKQEQKVFSVERCQIATQISIVILSEAKDLFTFLACRQGPSSHCSSG